MSRVVVPGPDSLFSRSPIASNKVSAAIRFPASGRPRSEWMEEMRRWMTQPAPEWGFHPFSDVSLPSQPGSRATPSPARPHFAHVIRTRAVR